jgi:glycosyltransferase involved in cell wall biosynthesis
VICQNSHFTKEARHKPLVRWSARHIYHWADAIVSVSQGVAEDLCQAARLPRQCCITIYNPSVPDDLEKRIAEPAHHPWFVRGSPPVILAIGRLHEQKDFPTLLRAFAQLRRERIARLVIFGTGAPRMRDDLLALARELGVDNDVDLPGFTENVFPYLVRAAVFALSSAWEGWPNVLVEALACGCPVVSTDCPSGPRDLLDKGRYGVLVPVRDSAAMAAAFQRILDEPPEPDRLRERASQFTVASATKHYLDVLLSRPHYYNEAADNVYRDPAC